MWENQHLFITLKSKNQKNTRGTRAVIHLSMCSFDAMYRVREGKSKLEPFYRLFRELFAICFWPQA